ncbi:hypothetical protein AB0G64_09375 [Streptomyces longwoodensis]|uniref:hypothetical protein n=1 Tax=Streptomyces longwoodensis TaxID=68231 RepID=UPI00341047F5
MRVRTAAITVTLLLAAATACSSESDDASAKPSSSPTAAAASTTTAAFTEADCRAVLDTNYEAGTPQDVSAVPECAALSHDQYVKLVGEVLTSHKDDILSDAADEVVWDTAWDDIDTDAQASICALLTTEGPEAAEGLSQEQAEYYRDNKC